MSGVEASSVKVQCLNVSPSGNTGANGMQGQLLCLNTGNLVPFSPAGSSCRFCRATHIVWLTLIAILVPEGVHANPDSRAETYCIELSQVWVAIWSNQMGRGREGSGQLGRAPRERGWGYPSSPICFLKIHETAFWLWPEPTGSKVLIPSVPFRTLSTSQWAQQFSRPFPALTHLLLTVAL